MKRARRLPLIALLALLAACVSRPNGDFADLYRRVDADPNNLPLRHGLARALLAAGWHEAAGDQYGAIFHRYHGWMLVPPPRATRPEEDYAAGCAALLLGQLTDADAWLAAAIDRNPRSVALLQTRAIALFRRKLFGRAVALLIRARQAAAARPHPEAFDTFPDALDKQMLKRMVRECFKQQLDGRFADAPDALAENAIHWFPDWGLAHAARARELERSDQPAAARNMYQRALELSPRDLYVMRAARLFFVRRGEYAAAYRAWRAMVPSALLRAPDNRVRDRWKALAEATEAAQGDARAASLVALARVCDRVGWTEEALAVLNNLPASDAENVEADALRERLTAHLDFVERIRNYMRVRYHEAMEGGDLPSAEEILRFLHDAGAKSRAVRFDPDEELASVLFAGRELFPTNDPTSPLTAYFLSHGQFFALTQGWAPSLVKLMNVLYQAEAQQAPPGDPDGQPLRYRWYICDEARIPSYSEFLANRPRIAGLTCISATGFVVDAQALRPRPHVYQVPEPGKELGKEPDTRPLFARAADSLHRRLLREMLDGLNPDDPRRFEKLFAARIDKVAAHEFGHVVDLRNHLPILAHLPANLWLALANGASAARIRARGETVAEAAGLALARNPHMVVRDNLLWLLPQSDRPYWNLLMLPAAYRAQNSPYRAAGNALVREITDRARERLERTGRLDTEIDPLLQLHKLTPEELRSIGQAICRDRGLD